jgi:hypothetical protein
MIGPDRGAKMAVWSASDPVRDRELPAITAGKSGAHSSGTPALRRPAKKVVSSRARAFGEG